MGFVKVTKFSVNSCARKVSEGTIYSLFMKGFSVEIIHSIIAGRDIRMSMLRIDKIQLGLYRL
jgi:hypothetical protein